MKTVDDLASVPGLEAKHRKVLAEVLKVTTCHGLVFADRQAIVDAMGQRRISPRPALATIAEWQDQARRIVREAVPDASDWDQAASFVVSFEHRRVDDVWERRLAVEQAELEGEQPPRFWSDWDCEEICTWMRAQLDEAEVKLGASTRRGRESPAKEAARPSLRIERATLIDEKGRGVVVNDNQVTSTQLLECTGPGRLVVAVSGAQPDCEVQLVIWLDRPKGSGLNPVVPVAARVGHPAELDLSALQHGDYDVSLVAWAPDGSTNPAVVKLPMLTIC